MFRALFDGKWSGEGRWRECRGLFLKSLFLDIFSFGRAPVFQTRIAVCDRNCQPICSTCRSTFAYVTARTSRDASQFVLFQPVGGLGGRRLPQRRLPSAVGPRLAASTPFQRNFRTLPEIDPFHIFAETPTSSASACQCRGYGNGRCSGCGRPSRPHDKRLVFPRACVPASFRSVRGATRRVFARSDGR